MAIGQKVKHTAIMRITGGLRERLESLIFSRYPDKEWATYFLFGTHRTADGMVTTVVDLIEPEADDLDSTTDIVRFTEPYSLRAALEKLCGLRCAVPLGMLLRDVNRACGSGGACSSDFCAAALA